jgi:N-acetylmuramoyl-L-alanine amidase
MAEPAPATIIVLDPGHGGKDRGGFDGKGFRRNGISVPEDPYTYDVAKRVERRAAAKGWTVLYTVIDTKDNTIAESDENTILPPRKKMIYSGPGKSTTVFPGKKGLLRRLETEESILGQYPHARIIFISLHFDYTLSIESGVKIFVPLGMKKHPLAKTLAARFKSAGHRQVMGYMPMPMIEENNRLVVLREGAIARRVLIELANFNNKRDRAHMLRSDGREHYAYIIVSAIEEYLDKN